MTRCHARRNTSDDCRHRQSSPSAAVVEKIEVDGPTQETHIQTESQEHFEHANKKTSGLRLSLVSRV